MPSTPKAWEKENTWSNKIAGGQRNIKRVLVLKRVYIKIRCITFLQTDALHFSAFFYRQKLKMHYISLPFSISERIWPSLCLCE